MKRSGSLVVFLAVGLIVSYLTRNNITGGTNYLVAFIAGAAAAWLYERAQMKPPKNG